MSVSDQTEAPKDTQTDQTAPAGGAPIVTYDASLHGDPIASMSSPGSGLDEYDPAFLEEMSALGLATPVADPTKVRRAFDMLNKMFTAILSPSDFMYSISYQEGGKTKQLSYQSLEHAQKAAEAYNVPIKASPKKSGISRLAVGLGIEATRVKTMGLPEDPTARYSCVIYEVVHQKTGRKAEGIGWADLDEKGSHMSRHDVIATADTRAYNRGVLRLSGFGDVSAEEILSVDMVEQPHVVVPEETTGRSSRKEERQNDRRPMNEPKPQGQQQPAPASRQLPETTSAEVLGSATSWAVSISGRPIEQRALPAAQQSTHEARTLRGHARMGDAFAAQQLGAKGLNWSGPAIHNGKAFFVEEPPEDLRAKIRANAAAVKAEHKTEHKPDTEPKQDQSVVTTASDTPAPESQPAADQPSVDTSMSSAAMMQPPPGDTIPSSMAKTLSTKMLERFGTRPKIVEWLKTNYGVESSIHMSPAQFSDAMDKLKKMEG